MFQGFDAVGAIHARRSARSYKEDRLASETAEKLKAYAETLNVPFAHNTIIRFFTAGFTKALYFSMKSPTDNVAFLSETDVVSISKTGFVGELFILFAQHLGVSTCWYGHYHLATLDRLMPHLPEGVLQSSPTYGYAQQTTKGVRAICTSPLGYYEKKGVRLMDRMTAGMYSFKRKEIAELLADPADFDLLSADMLFALDLARKAPSAANSQMWRFSLENNAQTLIIAAPIGYKHFKWEHPDVDIGICASHVWIGLLERGLTPAVSVCEEEGRAVWRFSLL